MEPATVRPERRIGDLVRVQLVELAAVESQDDGPNVTGALRVCVASEEIASFIRLPPGGEFLVWDGRGAVPQKMDVLVADSAYDDLDLTQLSVLRLVQLTTSGLGTWFERTPPNVLLCNARGVHGAATAELAVCGLLALIRGLPGFQHEQSQGVWAPIPTRSVVGRRVLILGAGDIGTRVTATLRALDARPTLVGRVRREGVHLLADVLPELDQFDAVIAALPLTAETTDLINAAFLRALNDNAVIVNVARGAIVDSAALLAELKSGRLSAFLDVTDPEPLDPAHPLWSAPRVLITPHVGAYTIGWQARSYDLVSEQIDRLTNGIPLQNVVEH